ncbi:hypothetical protein [Erwinia sp. S38]|uniref:hypothetical protein n=1 Tax=Erwinia sp. S38 TaxID=2769338 RepID=UPI00190AC046|nr:hypothetical protein [Erwinia sp. S38]MBK0001431.1 hypothetical protein [Erwinia sp. S38]
MRAHTNIDKGKTEREHMLLVLSRPEGVFPSTPENLSRDRLMRIRAGVQHLLIKVVPTLESSPVRQEVYLWLDEMLTILSAEQCCATQEEIKRGKGL